MDHNHNHEIDRIIATVLHTYLELDEEGRQEIVEHSRTWLDAARKIWWIYVAASPDGISPGRPGDALAHWLSAEADLATEAPPLRHRRISEEGLALLPLRL